MRATPFLLLTLTLAGCDVLGIGTDCTREARPAITVQVVDAATGGLPAADTGRVRVVDGAFVDSAGLTRLMLEQDIDAALAHERPGRYTVEVTVPGYEPWMAANVRVGRTDDRCHVQTQHVVAELVAAEPPEAGTSRVRGGGSE